jgi:MinD-like ATPase involved in chromosome partitioning or flagellar assembly
MILAVWGSSGSGKSTLSANIAMSLSVGKSNVILIDANFIVPQAGIWFPGLDIAGHASLSKVLQSEISPEIIAGKLRLINSHLGILGYAAGELSVNSILQRYDTAAALLNTAASIADYVILDCQTNITQDCLTFTGLEMAGCRLIVCTPDLRGASFFMSNIPMLADDKYRMDDAIRVFNMVKEISPVYRIESLIGSFGCSLPYDPAIELRSLAGFSANQPGIRVSGRYRKAMDSLISRIKRFDTG